MRVVPLVGCILGRAPVGKRIGTPEPIVTYLIRASCVRGWAALNEATIEAQEDQEQALQNIKDKNDIFFKGIGAPSNVQEQREHNFCYNPEQSIADGFDGEEPGTIPYQSKCNCADTCKGSAPGTKLTGQFTNRGPNAFQPGEDAAYWAAGTKKDCSDYSCSGKFGTLLANNSDTCYSCGKQSKNMYDYDRWIAQNPICEIIKRKYKAKVASSWRAFDTKRFAELRGMNGLITTIIEMIQMFVWQKVFIECWKNHKWDQDNLTRDVAKELVNTLYSSYFDGGVNTTGHVMLLKDGDFESVVDKAENGIDAGGNEVTWEEMREWIIDGMMGKRDSEAGCMKETCKKLQLCRIWDYSYNRIKGCYNEICLQDRGGKPDGKERRESRCQASLFNWWIYKNVYKKQIFSWWTMVRACMLEEVHCGIKDEKLALKGAYRVAMVCSMQNSVKHIQKKDGSLSADCTTCNQHFFWKLHHQLYDCSSCLQAISMARTLLDTCNFGLLKLQKECCSIGPGEDGYEENGRGQNPNCDSEGEISGELTIYKPNKKTSKCYTTHKLWKGDNVDFCGGLGDCTADVTAGDESMQDCMAVAALLPATEPNLEDDETEEVWTDEPHSLILKLTSTGEPNGEWNEQQLRIAYLETYLRNLGSPSKISIAMSDPYWVVNPTSNANASPIFKSGVSKWGPGNPGNGEDAGIIEGWYRRWDGKTFEYDWSKAYAVNTGLGGFTSGFDMQSTWWKAGDALKDCCSNMGEAIEDWEKLKDLKVKCQKSVTMGNPAGGGFNWDAAKTVTCSDIPLFNMTFKSIYYQRMKVASEMNPEELVGKFGAWAWADLLILGEGAWCGGSETGQAAGLDQFGNGFYVQAATFPEMIEKLHFSKIPKSHENHAAAKEHRALTLWACWTIMQGGNPQAEGFGRHVHPNPCWRGSGVGRWPRTSVPSYLDEHDYTSINSFVFGGGGPIGKVKYRRIMSNDLATTAGGKLLIMTGAADPTYEPADYARLKTYVLANGWDATGDADSLQNHAYSLYWGTSMNLTNAVGDGPLYSEISAPNSYPSLTWVTGSSSGDILHPTDYASNAGVCRMLLNSADGAKGVMQFPLLELGQGEKNRLGTITRCDGKQRSNTSGSSLTITMNTPNFGHHGSHQRALATERGTGMNTKEGSSSSTEAYASTSGVREEFFPNSQAEHHPSGGTQGRAQTGIRRTSNTTASAALPQGELPEGTTEVAISRGGNSGGGEGAIARVGEASTFEKSYSSENFESSNGQRGGENGTRGHGAGSNKLEVNNTAGREQYNDPGHRNTRSNDQGSGTAETEAGGSEAEGGTLPEETYE
jgi:hypothetical protein